MFVIDDLKFIKMFLTSNHCFKPLSSVHNIAFFSEKVFSSETGEKYSQIKHYLQAKKVQSNPIQYFGGF